MPVSPTRPTSQSACLLIRFAKTTSIMHLACRRGALAVVSATNAAQSAQPPTQWLSTRPGKDVGQCCDLPAQELEGASLQFSFFHIFRQRRQ